MREIFSIIYKKNVVLHVICVVLIFFNLYLILNLIIYKTNLQSYEDIFVIEDLDEFYYYSSEVDLSNNFYKELEKIKSMYPNAEVGYYLESTAKTEDGREISVIYLNPVLQKISYKLCDGIWLSDVSEVVIGKSFIGKSKVGEKVEVKNSSGKILKKEIVGCMKNSYVMEFSISSMEMTIPFLVREKENICLTIDKEILDFDNIKYPRLGVVLKIADEYKDSIKQDKKLCCFTDIIKNTKKECYSKIGRSNTLQILLAVSTFMNITILGIYNMDTRREFLRLVYVCGLEKWKIFFLEEMQILTDYIIALFTTFLCKCIIPDQDIRRMFLKKYVINFMEFQVIFVLIVIIIYGISLHSRLKKITRE